MPHSGVGSSSGYHQRTFPLQKSSSSGGRTVTSTIDSNSGLGNPQHQQPHGHGGLSSTLHSQPYYGESNSFNWKTSSSSSRVVQDCFVTPTRVRRATAAAASTASAKNPVTSKSTTSSHGPRGGSLFLIIMILSILCFTSFFAKTMFSFWRKF